MTVDVERLQRQLEFKEAELLTTKEENILLRRIIRSILTVVPELPQVPKDLDLSVPDTHEASYQERREHFTELQRYVFTVLLGLANHGEREITTKKMVASFANRFRRIYGEMTNPGETIGRRLRELAELKRVVKPTPETWFPAPEELEPPPTAT